MAIEDPLRMVFFAAPYNRHYTRKGRRRSLVVNISNEILSYKKEWEKIPELVAFKRLVRGHSRTHGLRRGSEIPS